MGKLDDMAAATAPAKDTFESIAERQVSEQGGSPVQPSQSYADLTLGVIAAFGIGGIVLALLTGSLSSADAAMLFGALVGLVVLFAILKLFTIATTLKEILAELRKK